MRRVAEQELPVDRQKRRSFLALLLPATEASRWLEEEMALIDNPSAWILRLFEMEEREGRGADCERFPDGVRLEGVPLAPDEKVFGIYKGKYVFTPQAMLTKTREGWGRLAWHTVVNCSSEHGQGKKKAELTLTDGSVVTVKVGDFATGWSGRISQLFHQMIQKWGARATLGPLPMSVEDFFAASTDDYDFAPNLEPHPTGTELRDAFLALRGRQDVVDVLLHVTEIEDGVPSSDALLIRTADANLCLPDFVAKYGADGLFDAPEDIARFFPDAQGVHTKMIAWD